MFSYRGYSCYARATITLVNFADSKDNHSRGIPMFVIYNFVYTHMLYVNMWYNVHGLCDRIDVYYYYV